MGIFKLFKNSSQGLNTKSSSDSAGPHTPGSDAPIPERSFKGPKRAIRSSTKGDGVALQTIPYATLTRDVQRPTPSKLSSSRSTSLYTEAFKDSDTHNNPAEERGVPLQADMERIDQGAHSLLHDRGSHASRLASTSSTVAADDKHSPGATSRPAYRDKADVRQRRSLFSLRSFSGGRDAEDNRLGEWTRKLPTESEGGQPLRLDSGTDATQSSKQPGHRQVSELDLKSRLTSSTPLASPGFQPQGEPLQSKSVARTEPHASNSDYQIQSTVHPHQASASPDDSYFEVRNFRHVSGTGGSPWQRPALPKSQIPSSPASRPDATPTALDHEEILFDSARPNAPKLSRPPSFAGSIGGEEPARQVSAHMFRQARRQSTSSVFTLEAYQQPDDLEDPSSRPAVPADQSVRLGRTSTRESSIEMLASPEREPLGAPGRVAHQDRHTPLTTRSSSSRQTVNVQVSPASREWKFPQKGLEPAAQILTEHAVNPERGLNRAANVTLNQRRAFSFGGAVVGQIGSSAHPGSSGDAQTVRLPNKFVKNHDRSHSASAMPVRTSDLHSQALATNRIPLSERLASATSVTPSSAFPPDVLIPPVDAQSQRVEEGMEQRSFPSSSSLSKGATDPVSNKSSPAYSPVRKHRLRQGWDSSSSDDSDIATGAHSKASARSKTTQPQQRFNNTARSLPSGVRKPPPPSEAFGCSDGDGASFRRPMKAGSRTPSSHSIRSLLSQPTSQNRTSTTGRSSQFEDKSDLSSSSSDESLAVIMRKHSKTSLKAQFAASTPNLTSPGKQPVSPASARSQPMKSAMKGVSAAETLTARSAGQRALPVPPLAPALPVNPLLSAFDQKQHSWPRESPASSQSGTTGEGSSRNGPLTPQDMSIITQTLPLNTPSLQHEDRFLGTTSRRVSFMNAEWDRSPGTLDSDEGIRHMHGRQALLKTGNGLLHPEDLVAAPDREFERSIDLESPHYRAQLGGPDFSAQQNMQLQMQMQMQMQLQMQMQWQQYHAAQMVPGYVNMHQQAMAAAKQQYQAAMAAAAIQAADEAWERASNVGGPTRGSPGFTSADLSGPGLFPFPRVLSDAGVQHRGSASVYGGSAHSPEFRQARAESNNGRGATSVYGGSFGLPDRAMRSEVRHESSAWARATSRTRSASQRLTKNGDSWDTPESSKPTSNGQAIPPIPPSSWKGASKPVSR